MPQPLLLHHLLLRRLELDHGSFQLHITLAQRRFRSLTFRKIRGVTQGHRDLIGQLPQLLDVILVHVGRLPVTERNPAEYITRTEEGSNRRHSIPVPLSVANAPSLAGFVRLTPS